MQRFNNINKAQKSNSLKCVPNVCQSLAFSTVEEKKNSLNYNKNTMRKLIYLNEFIISLYIYNNHIQIFRKLSLVDHYSPHVRVSVCITHVQCFGREWEWGEREEKYNTPILRKDIHSRMIQINTISRYFWIHSPANLYSNSWHFLCIWVCNGIDTILPI